MNSLIRKPAAEVFPELFGALEKSFTVPVWPAPTDQTPQAEEFCLDLPDLEANWVSATGEMPALPTHFFMPALYVRGKLFKEPVYLTGPTGAGKSSFVRWFCHRINAPMYEITGHDRLESQDLIGQWVPLGPMGASYRYGPLASAYKYGGVFLFNEIDLCAPGTLAGLNTILDGAPLCIPENAGEVIPRHPAFIFIATGNGNGADHTGLYAGVRRQNLAFMDRFTVFHVGYMKPDAERSLLMSKGLDEDDADFVVALAGEIRKRFADEQEEPLDITMSTRTCLRLASYVRLQDSLFDKAALPASTRWQWPLEMALLNRADATARTAIMEMVQRLAPRAKDKTDVD